VSISPIAFHLQPNSNYITGQSELKTVDLYQYWFVKRMYNVDFSVTKIREGTYREFN
jgi:hypothetical protein